MDAKTIDRMEVLNDKSAVEKYGDEAKGGVIEGLDSLQMLLQMGDSCMRQYNT